MIFNDNYFNHWVINHRVHPVDIKISKVLHLLLCHPINKYSLFKNYLLKINLFYPVVGAWPILLEFPLFLVFVCLTASGQLSFPADDKTE